MEKRITMAIVAGFCIAWVILPDYIPGHTDDIIAGIIGSVNIIRLLV